MSNLLNFTPVLVKTKEQIQSEVAGIIARETKNIYETLVGRYNDIMTRFWDNPRLTPNEVAAGLGTNAASLFQYGHGLATLILTINPEETRLKLPKFKTNFNPDGTVEVTEEPYS